MKAILFSSLLSLSLVLSSCGFRLKGDYDLPTSLQTVSISASKKFSPLVKELKNQLSHNRVSIVKASPNVSAIHILPERFQRKTLSLFPNGQVAEYELIYQVSVRLVQPNKEPEIFEFEMSREFQDDPNNSLAKERERELILNELRVLAAERILAQLSTVS